VIYHKQEQYYVQYQTNNNYDYNNLKEATIIGFDWGSCAWKNQCGAIADIQESYDEIDSLIGLLEP
jgi:hypothetical protein